MNIKTLIPSRKQRKHVKGNPSTILNQHLGLSLKNSILILGELALTVLFSALFNLPLHYSALLLVIGFLLVPFMVHYQAQWHAHETDFFILTDFLQQLIATFKQHPKIYASLMECSDVTQGSLKLSVDGWIHALTKGSKPSEQALLFLQDQPHFIIGNLIHLMLAVEHFGTFNYGEGLEIIQDDIEDWIEDTYLFKHHIHSTKNRIQLLSIFSLVIAYVSHSMLFQTDMIEVLDFYYLSLSVFLFLILITLFLAQRLIARPWIDPGEMVWKKSS